MLRETNGYTQLPFKLRMEKPVSELLNEATQMLDKITSTIRTSQMPFIPKKEANELIGSTDKMGRCLNRLVDEGYIGVVDINEEQAERKGRRNLLYNRQDILNYLELREQKAFRKNEVQKQLKRYQ